MHRGVLCNCVGSQRAGASALQLLSGQPSSSFDSSPVFFFQFSVKFELAETSIYIATFAIRKQGSPT
jgi:hypothetical protein